MERPNILMIVVDCLRSDRVFGENRTCKTPNVDKLVARGTSVPKLFVENSVTAPSFASLFTGTYSLYHGITSLLGSRLNPELTTLADIFMANGYSTYAEATGPLMPILGLDQGFDDYNYRDQREYYFTEWGDKLLERLKGKSLQDPWFMMVHFWELHEPRQILPEFDLEQFGQTRYDRAMSGLDAFIGKMVQAVGENTVIILTGDHGERIAEETAPDSILPYFMKKLDVPVMEDELSNTMSEEVELLNARGEELHAVSQDLALSTDHAGGKITLLGRLKLLVKLIKIALTRARIQKPKPGLKGFWELLKTKWADMKIGFAVIRGDSKDAQMHLLRTTLCQFHLQHGFHIYEYLANVPFVIAGLESLPKGKSAKSHVRHIDIFPTLCELLSFDVPEMDWHGSSFVGLMQNGKVEIKPIYMEARGGAQAVHAFYIRGVRSGGYKLAYTPYEPEGPTELYDLNADPDEQVNILADNPELAEKLRQEGEAMAQMFASNAGATEVSAEEQAEMVKKLKSLGYM